MQNINQLEDKTMTMTTSELRKALRQLDESGEVRVLVASDDEGNSLHELNEDCSFDWIGEGGDELLVIYPAAEYVTDEHEEYTIGG
jgi:hypothetical protein